MIVVNHVLKGEKVMKRIIFASLILVMLLTVPVMAGTYTKRSSSFDKCLAGGCTARRYNGSYYCSEHKCCIYDCKNRRGSDGMYCTKHHNQYYPVMRNHHSKSGSTGRSSKNRSSTGNIYKSKNRAGSGSSSESRKSSFDPDDV